jgi:hypothetical protein
LGEQIHDSLEGDLKVRCGTPSKAAFDHNPYEQFTDLLRELEPLLGERGLVLGIDEFEKTNELVRAQTERAALFDFFRSLAGSLRKFSFIFVGAVGLQEIVSSASVTLFNQANRYKISFLDRGAAEKLIRDPVRDSAVYDNDAVERILMVTGGHPYLLQRTCRALINAINKSADEGRVDLEFPVRVTAAMVDRIVEEGERGDHNELWDNLEALGFWRPLGESDEEAQRLLSGLAHLIERPRGSAPLGRLVELAGRRRPEESETPRFREEVRRCLAKLVDWDLVRERREDELCYSFTMDIIRRWLRRDHSYDDM